MNRRNFLQHTIGGGSAAMAAAAAFPVSNANATSGHPVRLGICAASYAIRSRSSRRKDAPSELASFASPVGQLKHFSRYDSVCAQIGVRGWDSPGLVRQIRDQVEATGTALEGQIRLPREESDIDRFAAELEIAKEAGVSIFRVVTLGTRRYETFETADAWSDFKIRSRKLLALAEKAAAKAEIKLAVENHKDWRTEELLDLLKSIDSAHVGVNLDTGNNMALLENPMAVVKALAPYAITLHLKDMGVAEDEDGFLLAEVPLGEGIIDIRQVVKICRKANPEVQFNLEMITRDPLKIPCLTDPYWATLGELSGQTLAATLKSVRRHNRDDLQKIGHLSLVEKIQAEEENISRSFEWWKKAMSAS